jgi:multidrug efflux pump subunit AcrB/ABC-type multidrug transport system ATPase subunit
LNDFSILSFRSILFSPEHKLGNLTIMNPFRFVIDRKIFVAMSFIAVSMLGWFSLRELPMEITPNSELPYLIVNVAAQNEIDPRYLEKQAVVPVESAVSRLEGVSEIETNIDQRRGTIRVTYSPDVKMKYAYLKLEEAMEAVKPTLSTEFTVAVQRVDTQQLSNTFMELQVRGSGGLERVRALIDRTIQRELEAVNGIASVNVTGGRTKSVEVLLDDDAAKAYNITPSTIRSLISSNNQSKAFLGEAHSGGRRYFVTLVTDYTDIRDLENLVVKTDGPVFLKDVATVSFGSKKETSYSRVNGADAVTIQLTRDSQANLIDLARSVRKVVKHLNEELVSQDATVVIQTDQAADMEHNINIIEQLALMGALFAMAVLWLFLRNFRLVAVIVFAIPISILTAFNCFYAFGISINTLTLVGIALAVGMLLDNGVVVLENIMRLLAAHRDRDTAVLQGTSEVWRAILASTATTVTVFLPFLFSTDYALRIIGRHVGVSIVSTLIISLFVGLFLTPMIVHALLGMRTNLASRSFTRVSFHNRLIQIYILLLKTAMRFPGRTVFGAAVAFFVTLALAMSLSLNVSREVELKEFSLYLTPPRGSTLDSTDLLTRQLEGRLADLKEKKDLISHVNEDESTITVVLADNYQKISNRSIPRIKEDIQKRIDNFPGAEVSLSEPRASSRYGGGGAMPRLPLEQAFGIGTQRERVLVKGNDFNMLRTVGEDLRSYLEQLESVQSVSFNVADNRPEVHILFDRLTMSRDNIPISSVASELSSFGREVSTTVPFKQGVDEYDITILNEAPAESTSTRETEKSIDDLRQLRIPSSSGAVWDLDQIGNVVYDRGSSSIRRLNQEQQLEVSYQFTSDVNQSKPALESARQDVDEVIAGIAVPPGVSVQVLHEETNTNEFLFLIAAAFILIYMILASVFESFTSPLVMMFTIPLAAIGALWGLILTNNSLLTAASLIGLLILLGVVVNNGILLIDYTRILRKRGYGKSRALMTSGRARLRPILITSITTVVGMIPLAMGKSEYVGMIGAPFAITVVGGLSLSTLFTLVFIPTVYSGLESALEWFRALDWKAKVFQAAGLAALALVINSSVDGLLWKSVWWTLALVMVPTVFWFATASLRQARAEYIGRGEPITISIRRLVKNYDADGRFVREWKKGTRMAPHDRVSKLDHLVWEIPFLGFLIYFVYWYLQSGMWMFLFVLAMYAYVLFLWRSAGVALVRLGGSRISSPERIGGIIMRILVWGFPAANLAAFHFHGFRAATIVFVGALWYTALLIHAGAERSRRKDINIARLTGRFARLRRFFYEFVRAVPLIGRKKRPFCALDTVSLEISSGMFGLLGPNGAGKTTVMRIICGVLNQSMGSMRINGIDFKEKREELQGLIGYLPQEFGTYENMRAREFLDYIAILKRIYDREERARIVDSVLASVHLSENAEQKIGSYSGGMKQRMGIALTLLHLPRILVVDEPTAGLDPRERIRFRNLLVELSRERVVIFSTHIIEDISSSCNRVAVLNRGSLSYLGNPREMTDAVRGKVWQFMADDADFERERTHLRIVHHMRIDGRIRVRCLSEDSPRPDAQQVQPTLEDAYLWLIGTGAKSSGDVADGPAAVEEPMGGTERTGGLSGGEKSE